MLIILLIQLLQMQMVSLRSQIALYAQQNRYQIQYQILQVYYKQIETWSAPLNSIHLPVTKYQLDWTS